MFPAIINGKIITHETRAQEIWDELTPSEKTGVKFGLFSAKLMTKLVLDEYDPDRMALTLMNLAREQ